MNDTVPDSLQIITLLNIAYQYPSSGGEAVYWARAILHLDIEDQLIPLRRRSPMASQFIRIGKMYPNLGSNEVTYEYLLKDGEKGQLEIYDQLNKKIAFAEAPVNTKKLILNTALYENGVYYYRFSINGKIVDRNKLIIIK